MTLKNMTAEVLPLYEKPAYQQPPRPVLVVNTDLKNPIFWSSDPSKGTSTIPPLGSLATDGASDIWGTTGAIGLTALADVIIGGTGWSPSPAQIAQQIAQQGVNVTVNGQSVVTPSGDTSGATDSANLSAAFSRSSFVTLGPGVYYVNAPVALATGDTLAGQPRGLGVPADNYGISGLALVGAVIKPVAAFAGSAVLLADNSAHVTQAGNIAIDNIGIDGSLLPANTVDGIKTIGSVAKTRVTDTVVYNVGGHGINLDIDAGSHPGDAAYIRGCHLSKCGGYGVRLIGCGDGNITDTECSTNGSGGYLLQNTPNMRLTGCKAEWSGAGPGYEIKCTVGSTMYATLAGCTSEHNWTSGILLDGGNTGNNGTIIIDGYQSVGDNRGAVANTAAIESNQAGLRVMVSGARTDGATTYGASQIGSSYSMYLTGCALFGATAATFDDGTNTLALVSQDQIPQDPPHAITTGFPAGWTGSISYFSLHEARLVIVNVNLSVAAGTAITVGEVINTLPAAYRPPSRKQYAVDASPNVAADFTADIQVQTTGNIAWVNPAFTVAGGDTLLLKFDLIFTLAA